MGRILARSVKFVDFQIKSDSNLVRCVKLYPIIYDKRNLLYLNRKVQRRIWEFIAKNLQSTAKECEERWITLLDIYEKCKNGPTIIMHDVLIEQLDELLNSIPEETMYGMEVEELEDMLNYNLTQISKVGEEMTENASSAASERNNIIFLATTKDNFEDGVDLETCFPELLDEACSLPPSEYYNCI